AHELAEIRAGHRRETRDDVLRPGGQPARVKPGEAPPLSPHDEGRLAELAVIARQIETATDPRERTRLRADAERLVSELGLVGPSAAADARRRAAAACPELPERARTLLAAASADAETNPFVLRLSGDPNADLATLRRSLARIDAMES